MSQPTTTTTAPSAAPAAAGPVSTPAPVTPAPVAAAAAPQTLNDYVELARKDIANEQPASPAPDPQATGQEPSPEAAAPDPAEPSSETVESPEATEGDEPTEADMANWTEGEKKLHGALVKERAESKEARAKNRELEARLAEIEKQLNPDKTPPVEPAAPVAPAATSSVAALNDCQTFEDVDAKVAEAANTELKATRLQNMLNRNGVEPVAERLLAEGVKEINGKPVTEADADEIGDFLAAVYEGSKLTQAQAPLRKTWLAHNQQSLQQAVQLVPELNDANSAAYKAAVAIVSQNPQLRSRADWPVVVAKLWLGEQVIAAKSKPAPAAPAKAAPARPAARPAPGAPRTSTAALPNPSKRDALSAKIAAGTASMDEVQEYARGSIAA